MHAARLGKTIISQVSVLKIRMLQLVPGNLEMSSQHRMCLRLARCASVLRHERAVAAGCCEGSPVASGIPAGKTVVACGG